MDKNKKEPMGYYEKTVIKSRLFVWALFFPFFFCFGVVGIGGWTTWQFLKCMDELNEAKPIRQPKRSDPNVVCIDDLSEDELTETEKKIRMRSCWVCRIGDKPPYDYRTIPPEDEDNEKK